MIITLEDALASGRGTERPFTCPAGEHSHPTASVNVVKGVWFCYSCQAKGAVDSNRVPTNAELEAMLDPEAAVRRYPSSWLTTFGVGGYWEGRFPDWLCWWQGFGEDPWSGEGTYPVHTSEGTLAGVGRRALAEGPWPKYKYPRAWSASRSLFGSRGQYRHHDVLMLVEGAADAAAGWEVGCPTFATFGSGVHAPQLDLIARMTPKLILLGQDNDDAGNAGAEQTIEALGHRARWPAWTGGPTRTPPRSAVGAPAHHRRPHPWSLTQCEQAWDHTVTTVVAKYEEETRG